MIGVETLEQQKQIGLEYLRGRLRAVAQEREFGRMRADGASEDIARLARLASETPLRLAEAAREAARARGGSQQVRGQAASAARVQAFARIGATPCRGRQILAGRR